MNKLQLFVIWAIIYVTSSHLFPHKIWIYENIKQQKLGVLEKNCLKKIRQLHKQTDWQINYVSQNTIKNFLNAINYEKFEQLFNKKLKQSQIKAQLIRYYLLMQHGGVWLDHLTLLLQNLNWLDRLSNNARVLHKNIYQNPQIFLYVQHQTDLKLNDKKTIQEQKIKIDINGYNYYPLFHIQNEFIAAIPGSRYIQDLITQFQKLLLFGEEYFNRQKQNLLIPYNNSDQSLSQKASSIIQYKKYIQYQQGKKYKSSINSKDHFYNILIMNQLAGIYHATQSYQRIQQYLIGQQAPKGDHESQLIIFTQPSKKMLMALLNDQKKKIQLYQKQINFQLYQFGQKFIKESHKCLNKILMHQNSVLNKYLLSNEQSMQNIYPYAEILKNSQIPLICKLVNIKSLKDIISNVLGLIIFAVIIFLFIEIALQYYFYFFKITKEGFIYLKKVQDAIYKRLIFLVVIYFHKKLLFSQYQLWTEGSPTAFFVGGVQLIFTGIIFKWFIEIDTKTSLKNNYLGLLLLIQLIQYGFQYLFSVWKYSGQIYNYQGLNYLNISKIEQGKYQLVNVFTLVIFFKTLMYLKKIINLFDVENEKQWVKNNAFFKKIEIQNTLSSGTSMIEHEDGRKNSDIKVQNQAINNVN